MIFLAIVIQNLLKEIVQPKHSKRIFTQRMILFKQQQRKNPLNTKRNLKRLMMKLIRIKKNNSAQI